jgi:hypothetical protein
MKNEIISLRPVAFGLRTLLTLAWIAAIETAAGQNTAFTNQGRLSAGGSPAHGVYDLTQSRLDVRGSIRMGNSGQFFASGGEDALRRIFGLGYSSVNLRAQSYSIDWFTIDGGGASSGGVFSVSGTIGQPDANAQPMTGGQLSLVGGFWSLFAVKMLGTPFLTIHLTMTNTAVVAWPSSSSMPAQVVPDGGTATLINVTNTVTGINAFLKDLPTTRTST